jgi:hypothetical protein
MHNNALHKKVNIFAKRPWTPIGSPGNRYFLLFFAFDCLGVKMKNPETETISGFCCKLHFHSAERGGLFTSFMIPGGCFK